MKSETELNFRNAEDLMNWRILQLFWSVKGQLQMFIHHCFPKRTLGSGKYYLNFTVKEKSGQNIIG